ncbi:MAG TPA: MFS transporter [Candidatus Acidoferrum sp.]|nr:MFS transporter [Candidatus Acidoferrum sp.]
MTSGIQVDVALTGTAEDGIARRNTRAFRGVMAAFLVHGLIVSTWVSRIAGMKGALHLGDGTLGLSLLGAAIGSVTAIPISGALVTRYGSRRIALGTAVGFCLSLVPLALSNSLAILVPALVFYGMMAGANDVAMNALAVGTERLLGTPTISRFHAMFSLGGILGASVGAAAAARGVSLTAQLLAGAAVTLIIVAVVSRLVVETRTETTHAHARLRRVPLALVALSAIGFCIFLSEGAIADWTAVYLKQVLHAGAGMVPVGYAVFSATMALFRFIGDAITLRIGRAWTIRAGGSIAALGLAVVVAAHTPYAALAGFALAGAGFSSIIPLVFAAGGRIPGVGEGAGVATVSGLGYLGFLVGPPAIGFISEASSLRAGLGLLVVLSVLAVALVGVVQRQGDPNPLS